MKGLSGLLPKKARTADPLTDEKVVAAHQQRLRQALDDSSLLIAFVSDSKRAIEPETLNALIKATLQYQEDKSLAKNAEAEFWNAYSKLTTAVQPSSVAGIRNGDINKDLGFVGWMIKYPWISLPATVALALFIVLQIYTVRGAHLLKQFDSVSSAQTEAQQAVMLEDAASEPPKGMPARVKLAMIEINLDRYKELLAEWNNCTLLTVFLFCPPAEMKPKPSGPSKTVVLQATGSAPPASIGLNADVDQNAVRAQMRLNNLNASILPMILGLLGACTSVLRSIARRVIDQSMNTTFLPAYYVRIVLGMIIGATIGLFLLPSPASDAENPFAFLTNLPLLTAAFLAGYAAEVFFALLDRIVGDARNYVTGNKDQPAK